MELETVKVVREGSEKGYKIINKDDFDPKVHKLYGEPNAPKKAAPKKAAKPAPKKRGRPRKKAED